VANAPRTGLLLGNALVGSDVLPPTVLLLFPVQLNDVGVLLRLAEQVAAEVFAAALRLRRDASDLFLDGDYLPLETDAPFDGKVIAFARTMAAGGNRQQPNVAIVIAPYLVARMTTLERPLPLADIWKTTRVLLPPSLAALTYTDVFTGLELRPARHNDTAWLFVGQALRVLPVALLTSLQFPTPPGPP